MNGISLLFVVIGTTLLCALESAFSNLITTPSGKIEGKTIYHDDVPVRAFLGIPYAKPPLKDLRFKKPVPIETWNIILQAKHFPPGCVQYSPKPFPWEDKFPGLSEDCLYLNIWAPMDTRNKKSVMFWVHGGGFGISSSRIDFFHGQALAKEGDVIVVTTNYRLGAEGFFYSGTKDAPGNMGMWDIVEALKWVRNNIESFGGDKDSITLFGQSAGGIVIGMFCVSPVTRGLFKRAILQSGTPTNLDGEDNERSLRTSQKVAEAVGCASNQFTLTDNPKTVVECLKSKHPYLLAEILRNVTSGQRVYYPRYGDEFLPKNPREAIINGEFDPVDVLIGTNSGDGSTLITSSMMNIFGFFGEKNPQINLTFGASLISEKFKSYPDPDAVVRHYLGGVKEDDYDKIRFEVFNSFGDYKRICPSFYFAESFAKKHASVYYYFFTQIPSNMPWAAWMLAVHFDETPFVFGYPLRYPQNYTVTEQGFSRRLIEIWSNFTKTGHLPSKVWKRYSQKNPVYTVLDITSVANGKGPHEKNCDFFRSHFGF